MLEQAIMAQDISIPVFFSKYNEEFDDIVKDISTDAATSKDAKQNAKRDSAISELFSSVSANGYQVHIHNFNDSEITMLLLLRSS